MENQNGTVDRMVEAAPFFGSPVNGRETTLSQPDASEEAPAASLVGSLSVFSLSDVLSMLASTAQTGELQVVGEAVDGRVWLDHGELSNAHVGAATTMGQAVFELACAAEGWFYFTSGLRSSSGQPTVPVAAVLTEVRPQVDEWREIRDVVPLEAVVSLCPEPPGQDVQIRNDQWRVLTTVGTSGHSVKSVLDMIGGDQIVGLRTLRDLHIAGLIELAPAPAEPEADPAPSYGVPSDSQPDLTPLPSSTPMVVSEDSLPDPLASVPSPRGSDSEVGSGGDGLDSLAEVAIMPPPIAGDPWAPIAEPNGTDDGVA
jgi:hypothetical protein